MKIAVLIITRGNRPELFENCLRLVRTQTRIPDHIEVVIDTPISNDCDITWRYKLGYDRLRNKGFDVIFLMEDDDYYASDYIEVMLSEWTRFGKPNIFGTNYTIYYNIRLFAWFTYYHDTRSSAMSTMIKPDLNFEWCPDNEPFTDMHLWKVVRGLTFKPHKNICLGIKHGTTMTGGKLHNDRLHRYRESDPNKDFLKQNVDAESFEFYSEFISTILKKQLQQAI